MEFIDYYKILGINKSATDDDVKKAYRKLARKFHPDLNPNDTAAKTNFQKINEANEVLSDPEKRKKYDQHGKDWQHADEAKRYQQERAKQQGQPFTGGGQGFSGNDFSDFFESMFGGQAGNRRGGQVKYRGQDISAELHLDLKDIYTTHKQTLTVNGKSIRLTIPAGVENGQTIKIAGHGGEGVNGGPNGDLYITFSILNSTKFRREGNNLHTDVELNLYTAVLGGEVTIDAFDGKVKLTVNPETQSGTKVKLKGKGFPVYKKDGEFGDLYVTWQVKLPTNLSDKEKELFTELSKVNANGK
ncbi:MAG: J domain-containing protein [Bacteroidia bacterium]|nr:J domain-containing protein [Bacteroidia bacterium]